MSGLVYILCTITSLASAILLARAAWRPRGRLMFWSAIAFFGMSINNVLLYVDLLIGPHYDWSIYANVVALVSVLVLVYALIWEAT
jgi:hypothetical protein